MNFIHKYHKYKSLKKLNIDNDKDLITNKYSFYKKMIGGFKSLNNLYITEVNKMIHDINNQRDEKTQIDESHGLNHYLVVVCNVSNALDVSSLDMTDKQKLLVKLAALLHDIDDHKYFPSHHNFENARELLNRPHIQEIDNLTRDDISTILLMIHLVSSSVHGDTIPSNIPEWYLYPRYADRLESLGIIGLERTLEYTIKKSQPLFTSDTKRAINLNKEELYESIATIERYNNYKKSVSMIDHFYDKLLRLGDFPIHNDFFKSECEQRIAPLVDFIIDFPKIYPEGELITDINHEAYSQVNVDSFKQYVHEFIKNHPYAIPSECSLQINDYMEKLKNVN